MSEYQATKLKNGLSVITASRKDAPDVAVQFWSKSGSRFESNGEWGYAHVLEHLMLKGTKKYPDIFSLNLQFDNLGSYKNALTGSEGLRFVAQAAVKHRNILIELIAEIIRNALLKPDVLEKEKPVIVEEMHRTFSNPETASYIFNLEKVFEGHPLSKYALGSEESIKKATSETLRRFKEKYLIPERSALIVCGDIKYKEIVSIAEKCFGDWQAAEVINDKGSVASLKSSYYYKKTNTPHSHIFLNYYNPGFNDEKVWPALEIIANFLGYGFTSVLMRELRVKHSLVYGANAVNVWYTDNGNFRISTASSKPKKTVEVLLGIMDALHTNFTKKDFDTAKGRIEGLRAVEESSVVQEAEFLGDGFITTGNLFSPDNYLKAIKALKYEDAMAVIIKYLTKENGLLCVFGPEDIREEKSLRPKTKKL